MSRTASCHQHTGKQPDLRVTSVMRSVGEGERRAQAGPGATTGETGLRVRASMARTQSGLAQQVLAETPEALAAVLYEVVYERTCNVGRFNSSYAFPQTQSILTSQDRKK